MMRAFDILTLVSFGIAYLFFYSNRNIITAASPYLIDHGAFSKKTFAVMQTGGYAMMIFAKFTIGLILSVVRSEMKRRTILFTILLCVVAMALIATCVTGMVVSIAERTKFNALGVVFCAGYMLIKIIAAVIRPVLLSVCHIATSERFSPKRSGSHQANGGVEAAVQQETIQQKTLGWVTSAVQCISCAGDSLGKIVFTSIVSSHHVRQLAARWQIPSWSVAVLFLGGLNLIFALWPSFLVLFGGLRRSKSSLSASKSSSSSSQENALPIVPISSGRQQKPHWRELLFLLFRKPTFLLLLTNNLICGFCSVASGAYAVHFYRYGLLVESIQVTRVDAIAPACIAVGIFVTTWLMQRYRYTRGRVYLILSVMALLDACLLRGIAELLLRSDFTRLPHDATMIALFMLHQTLFFGIGAAFDGSLLTCMEIPSHAIVTATGIVSAFGYAGGIFAPLILFKWTSTLVGWTFIIELLSYLQIANIGFLSAQWVFTIWNARV